MEGFERKLAVLKKPTRILMKNYTEAELNMKSVLFWTWDFPAIF
jgi:hypothetical protein